MYPGSILDASYDDVIPDQLCLVIDKNLGNYILTVTVPVLNHLLIRPYN